MIGKDFWVLDIGNFEIWYSWLHKNELQLDYFVKNMYVHIFIIASMTESQ